MEKILLEQKDIHQLMPIWEFNNLEDQIYNQQLLYYYILVDAYTYSEIDYKNKETLLHWIKCNIKFLS